MADPQIADFYRAQVIFDRVNGIAKDATANSFVFRNDNVTATPDEVATQINNRLHDFYNVGGTWMGNATPSVLSYYPGGMFRSDVRLKVYDLGEPAGSRFPIERSFTATFGSTTAPVLPEEVSVVVSWVAGVNRPRSRGRTYLGPFLASVSARDNTTGLVRLYGIAHNAILAAADRLRTPNPGGDNVNLHVLSQRDLQAKEVTGGWVDDAFDTQRRRGGDPSLRVVFGAYDG